VIEPREERVIRVFVSSTFHDMQAERDELVKYVFPRLRRICEQRGLSLTEVDLRWGLTDEQAKRGEVLSICLAEIERSRPYFIGLLGERYGSVPDAIDPDLALRYPWLNTHSDCSVTELEMMHGALNDPSKARYAYFYFRAPCSGSGPAAPEPFSWEPDMSRAKLLALKERIVKSGIALRSYSDPKVLGELVLQDFSKVIDQRFPPYDVSDPLDRDAKIHDAYARHRAAVYVARPSLFARLDEHAGGSAKPMVVEGAAGIGKSSLLANWAARYRDVPMVLHFVGANPVGGGWHTLVRRLMAELGRLFRLTIDPPETPHELRREFAQLLYQIQGHGRVVLVIDGLDQLEAQEGAHDLLWLPSELPSHVRLIVSTLPGRVLDVARERGWSTLTVDPLDLDERSTFIRQYLAQYSKTLSPDHESAVANARKAENPLYLRYLLEELRLLGVHENLDERVHHYLTAQTVEELLEKVLERCEADYDRERPGLTRDALSLIVSARRGLSESELLELLGTEGQPLAAALWSPLHLALDHAFTNRDGLIGFSHVYMRQAVERRYLVTPNDRAGLHRRLSEYFHLLRHDLNPRTIEELPWQLLHMKDWSELRHVLSNLDFHTRAWHSHEFDILTFWAEIERANELQGGTVQAFESLLRNPDNYTTDQVAAVASLLSASGHAEMEGLGRHLVKRYAQADRKNDIPTALARIGWSELRRGQLDQAAITFALQTNISREIEEPFGIQVGLYNQSIVLRKQGRLKQAMERLEEAERFCRENGFQNALAAVLGGQANILGEEGDYDSAITRLKEAEQINRSTDNLAGLARCLGGQAVYVLMQGNLERSVTLHEEEERIFRCLGDRPGLIVCLTNRAGLELALGHLGQASALAAQLQALGLSMGSPEGTIVSLGISAEVALKEGNLERAEALVNQQERECRMAGAKLDLIKSLLRRADILFKSSNTDSALGAVQEAEQLAEGTDMPLPLFRARMLRSEILLAKGDSDASLDVVGNQEQSWADWGDSQMRLTLLKLRCERLVAGGRFEVALGLVEKHIELARQRGETESEATLREMYSGLAGVCAPALCMNAMKADDSGDRATALQLFERAVELDPKYGFGWSDLGICLGLMERHMEAKAALNRAVELIPDDAKNWVALAKSSIALKEFDQAGLALDAWRRVGGDQRELGRLSVQLHKMALEECKCARDSAQLMEGLARLDQMADLARVIEDEELQILFASLRAVLLFELGHETEARVAIQQIHRQVAACAKSFLYIGDLLKFLEQL
jgi:tetratricopeptide (TPR) repeat protein